MSRVVLLNIDKQCYDIFLFHVTDRWSACTYILSLNYFSAEKENEVLGSTYLFKGTCHSVFYWFRDRGRDRGKVRDKYRYKREHIDLLPSIHTLPGDWTYHLGICHNPKANQQPFNAWDNAQLTEPHWPEQRHTRAKFPLEVWPWTQVQLILHHTTVPEQCHSLTFM